MAIGYIDFATGYDVSLLVFYFLPILLAIRFVGTRCAFLIATMSALTWLLADIAAGKHYDSRITPVWNTVILLTVFFLVIILFSSRDRMRELVNTRTETLRLETLQRSQLQRELLSITEDEQRRIAHDLHDTLGQHLTATALAGKVLAKKMRGAAAVEPALADNIVSMLEEGIELTRTFARTLYPIELGPDGLEDGLRALAVNLASAYKIDCRFQGSGSLARYPIESGMHLYRIAQEAATNAVRHGHATEIVISLVATSESLMLSVTDNGVGLPAKATASKGLGLRIMDYRANLIGASFHVANLPQGGARAICILNPIRAEKEAHGE